MKCTLLQCEFFYYCVTEFYVLILNFVFVTDIVRIGRIPFLWCSLPWRGFSIQIMLALWNNLENFSPSVGESFVSCVPARFGYPSLLPSRGAHGNHEDIFFLLLLLSCFSRVRTLFSLTLAPKALS